MNTGMQRRTKCDLCLREESEVLREARFPSGQKCYDTGHPSSQRRSPSNCRSSGEDSAKLTPCGRRSKPWGKDKHGSARTEKDSGWCQQACRVGGQQSQGWRGGRRPANSVSWQCLRFESIYGLIVLHQFPEIQHFHIHF